MKYSRYRRNSAPREKFYFSEKEIDFTQDYFPYELFLLQEFFDPDVDKQIRVREAWILKYGRRSHDIMSRKYLDWRAGNYHLTEEMKERIVRMMPNMLSEAALKRVGLFEFSSAIKGIVKSRKFLPLAHYAQKRERLSIVEWRALVIEEFKSINQVRQWPHQYHPLSADDAQATVRIAQFILQLKLSRYEEQVLRDVLAMQPVYETLRRSGTEIKYDMRRFVVGLDLEDLPDLEVKGSRHEQYSLPSEGTNSTYQTYADKYFAYELAQVHSDVRQHEASAATFMSDLTLFLRQMEASRNGELETSLTQDLQGEGGVLKLRVRITPPGVAMSELKKATLKLASAVCGTALYIVLMIRFGLVGLLVFSALFILPLILPSVVGLIREISRARKGISSS